MPNFKYKAIDPEGKILESQLSAADKIEVIQQLRNLNLVTLEIHKAEKTGPKAGRKNIKKKQLIQFTKQLHTLLKAGIPVVQCLQLIREQHEEPAFQAVVEALATKVSQGSALSEAMSAFPKLFPPIYVNSVRIGEISGTLDDTLAYLYRYLEDEEQIRKDVKKALRYPTIVLLAIIGAFVVFVSFVIPAFKPIFEMTGAELPLPTRILLGISDLVTHHGLLLLVGVGLSTAGILYYKRTPAGRALFDRWMLRLPLVGEFVKKVALTRFAKIFHTLNRTGVPVVQAFEMLAEAMENTVYQQELRKVLEYMKAGEGIAASLAKSPYFSHLMIEMITIGERSGSLDEMLETVIQHYEREVSDALQRLTASIEPITTVLIGGMVLFLALSVLLPLWDTMMLVK